MKTFLFIGCFVAMLASPLSAQTTPTPPAPDTSTTPSTEPVKHHHHHHPDFMSQLGLSDSQKSQIDAIKKGGGDKKSKHEAIKALLTSDQQAKLKELKADWKAQHPKTT